MNIDLRSTGRRLATTLALVFAIAGLGAESPKATAPPQPVASAAIENLFRLGPELYSGGEPKSEAAFAQLQALGVKTIVSVDGATPDLATARRFGIRYVHLPLGYQGYSTNACWQLAKAGDTFAGPIFVHCHHGKHRGPAAAAIMAATRLGWTSAEAERWLQTAGTSTNYPGLFLTVRSWQRPAPAALAALSADFPEVSRSSDLAQAMVDVDRAWDRLKSVVAAGFRMPADHPDLVPEREASRVAERLAEAAQLPEVTARGAEVVRRFTTAADEARELARSFKAGIAAADEVRRHYDRVGRSCSDCHREHRDPASLDRIHSL